MWNNCLNCTLIGGFPFRWVTLLMNQKKWNNRTNKYRSYLVWTFSFDAAWLIFVSITIATQFLLQMHVVVSSKELLYIYRDDESHHESWTSERLDRTHDDMNDSHMTHVKVETIDDVMLGYIDVHIRYRERIEPVSFLSFFFKYSVYHHSILMYFINDEYNEIYNFSSSIKTVPDHWQIVKYTRLVFQRATKIGDSWRIDRWFWSHLEGMWLIYCLDCQWRNREREREYLKTWFR